MKGIVPFLLGRGIRFECEVIRHPTEEVAIGGVRWRAPRQLAQAIAAEQTRAAAEFAKVTDTAAAAIEAARGREREALALAEAAQLRARVLEAELAAERAGRAADRGEAVRAGVEAARATEAEQQLAGVEPAGSA